MTKILLLSDTHSYMGEEILKHVKQADEVWHACPVEDGELVVNIMEEFTKE